MKKQQVLNKKTGSVLLVLLVLALAANFYSKKREAKQASETETIIAEETVQGENSDSTYYIHLEDFSIGGDIDLVQHAKYGANGKTAGAVEVIEPSLDVELNKKQALEVSAQLQKVMQEVGFSVLTGGEFSALQPFLSSKENVAEDAEQAYNEAVAQYAYKDGNGIIKIDFTNVWAEVKEVKEDAAEVVVNMDFDYTSTISRMNEKSDTLESYEEDGSSTLTAEFQLEDGKWKLLY